MIKKVGDSYKHNFVSIAFGPFLKVIEAFFDLLIPLFMKAIIDLNAYDIDSINPISKPLASFIRMFSSGTTPLGDALAGGAIILIMGVVGYAITMVSQYIAAHASVSVGTEVRTSLYEKILHLSKKERDSIGSGKLQTIINNDTYQLQHGVLLFVRLVIRAPFILIGSLIISFILDPRIGVAFVGVVVCIFIVYALVLSKSSKEYVQLQNKLDDLSDKTSETVDGARVIRASNHQEYENATFEDKTLSYQNKAIKINRFNSLINPLTFAITSCVLVVIILLLKDDLFAFGSSGSNTLLVSTIIAEMAYLSQIFFVTVQLSQVAVELVKANVSKRRINSVLMIEPEINNDPAPLEEKGLDYEKIIKFDHVSFAFGNKCDNYFLNDLSFEIRKGETFGIIGGTGSGKSTIINLLERFYEVSKGQILYKGIPLPQYDLESLRNDIGLVNQKSSLFNGTIKSNYLMSNSEASDEDILNALKQAEAYEFVSKYEDGINHVVNEGGTNFSGGQRQRLCIGRALVRKPEILILDDATSALDLLTDKRIRETVSSFKDMTKIIVSQRVATIQNSDYILVLEGGKVVGLGKHEQLLNSCSIYREIYESQIKKE